MTAISTDASVQINTGKTYRAWFGTTNIYNYKESYYIAQAIISPSNSTFNYNNRSAAGNADVTMFFHRLSNSVENNDERVSFIIPDAHSGDFYITALSEDNITISQTKCTFTAKLYDDYGVTVDDQSLSLTTGNSGSIVLKDPNKPNKIKIDFSVPQLYTKQKLPVSITVSEER